MNPNPTHLPVPSLVLCPYNLPCKTKFQSKNKQDVKQSKTKPWHERCVTQWVTYLTLYIRHLYLRVLTAMSHWSGIRALATPSILGPHYDSYCCLLSLRSCCFGSAGTALSHAPVEHSWGGCWGGLPYSPGSGPGDQPACPVCQLSLMSTTLARKKQGQFSCSHTIGFSSPTLTPPEAALLFCPGKGPTLWLVERGEGQVLLFHFHAWRSSLLPLAGGKW